MKEIEEKNKKPKRLTWKWPHDFTHIGEKERKDDEKTVRLIILYR